MAVTTDGRRLSGHTEVEVRACPPVVPLWPVALIPLLVVVGYVLALLAR